MSRKNLPRVLRFPFDFLFLAGLVVWGGCQKTDDILQPSPDAKTVLRAIYRSPAEFTRNPIVLDGQMVEQEWGGDAVEFLNVRISDENGVGGNATPAYVSMKAVYTDRDLFLLVRWIDGRADEYKDGRLYVGPDLNIPGIYGCRQELMDDAYWWTEYFGYVPDEDRLAIAFEIEPAGNAMGSYRQIGCQAACHLQETPAFGRLDYGRLDVWQWLAARTNPVRDLFDLNDNPENPLYGLPGYLDDLISDAYSGLVSDPGTPSYVPNFEPGRNVPLYVYRNRAPDDPYAFPRDPASCTNVIGELCRANNGLGFDFLWRDYPEIPVRRFSECDTAFLAQPRDARPREWRPGDFVPGWIVTYPTGSRADVHGKGSWDRVQPTDPVGVWTLEIGRRLRTADQIHDVTFYPDSSLTYAFTVAAMDNSGRDQRGSEVQTLRFEPKPAGR